MGPLTLSRALSWIPRDSCRAGGEEEGQEGDGAAAPTPRTAQAAAVALEAVGAKAQALISTVQWGTIKGLVTVLGGVDRCLEWLGGGRDLGPEEVPVLRSGIEMLQRLDAEHGELASEAGRLRAELAASSERCEALARRAAVLGGGDAADRIIEQDREQIKALLADRAKLVEENAGLEREVRALQDLLQVAEERRRMAETPGPEEGGELEDDAMSDDSLPEQ